jgi:hypothetical protein
MSKKTRMKIEEFFPKYLNAVKADMTREEFAKSIGVRAETVRLRIVDLRKQGVDVPHLRTETRQTKSVVERAKEMLAASLAGEKPKAKAKPEPKAVKVEEVPEQDDALEEIFG